MIRNSVYFFALLAAFAVAGFWPTYLSRVTSIPELHVHLPGAVVALWVLLLLRQAFLIRSGRRAVHRFVGKISYVLAPLSVVSTLWLVYLRLREASPDIPVDRSYFFYVQVSLLAWFVLA